MNLKSTIRQFLNEARMMTHTGQLMKEIIDFLRESGKVASRSQTKPYKQKGLLDLRSFAQGTMALIRYELDGNAYEIIIRPAQYAEFKDDYGDIMKKKIDRSKFKPNKDEPRSIDDVKRLIYSRLKLNEHIGIKIDSIKNNKEVYKFNVMLSGYDRKQLGHALQNLIDEPFFHIEMKKEDKGLFDNNRVYLVVTYKKL
jgi:hypothetical protein